MFSEGLADIPKHIDPEIAALCVASQGGSSSLRLCLQVPRQQLSAGSIHHVMRCVSWAKSRPDKLRLKAYHITWQLLPWEQALWGHPHCAVGQPICGLKSEMGFSDQWWMLAAHTTIPTPKNHRMEAWFSGIVRNWLRCMTGLSLPIFIFSVVSIFHVLQRCAVEACCCALRSTRLSTYGCPKASLWGKSKSRACGKSWGRAWGCKKAIFLKKMAWFDPHWVLGCLNRIESSELSHWIRFVCSTRWIRLAYCKFSWATATEKTKTGESVPSRALGASTSNMSFSSQAKSNERFSALVWIWGLLSEILNSVRNAVGRRNTQKSANASMHKSAKECKSG